MIHHLSIGANDPQRVAGVLAELLGGMVIPFPPNPGAYMAIANDSHGTAVEVYPADTRLTPGGAQGGDFVRGGEAPAYGPVHFALSIPGSLAQVEAMARREGWTCNVCSRGGDFDVIEVWLENRFMVELLPPDFAARYLSFTGRFSGAKDAGALMASHPPRVGA
jgi:hypothetical protein